MEKMNTDKNPGSGLETEPSYRTARADLVLLLLLF